MKKILAILIAACISSQIAFAGDVRDFKIDGIGIGDSLLDYYSKKQIKSSSRFMYKDKTYSDVLQKAKNDSEYEYYQFVVLHNDPKYLIYGYAAKILYDNKDFNDCLKQEKKILNEIKSIFEDSTKYKDHGITPHPGDPSGKTKGSWHTFMFNDDSGHVSLECIDWSEETGFIDNLKINIISKKYNEWLLENPN